MDLIDLKYLFKHGRELLTRSTSIETKDDWFYFIHIPKTAGTSIRYMLYKQFKAIEIYPNNVDFYILNKGKYVTLKDFKSNHNNYITKYTKLLMGHFRLFPVENWKGNPPKTFTFFRDPISRIVSTINYHKKKGRRYENLTEEDIISKIEIKESQQMARTFGYDPIKNNIKETLENISKVDAIGITENMDISIKNINKTFRWQLISNSHRNKSNQGTSQNKGLINKIESLNMIDVVVYNHAKSVFKNQCNYNGIEFNPDI